MENKRLEREIVERAVVRKYVKRVSLLADYGIKLGNLKEQRE